MRRALVQATPLVRPSSSQTTRTRHTGAPGVVEGTIAWWEHAEAWQQYDKKWHCDQSAERINELGGFGWHELVDFLGHEPTTWEPR